MTTDQHDPALGDSSGMALHDGGVVVENGQLKGECPVIGKRAPKTSFLSSETVDLSKGQNSDKKPRDLEEHPSSSLTLPSSTPPLAKTLASETRLPSSQSALSTTPSEANPPSDYPTNNPLSNQPLADLSADRTKITQRVIQATAFFRETAEYMLQAMCRIEASETSPEVKLGKMRVWTESCVRKFQKLEKGLQVRRVVGGGSVGLGGVGEGEIRKERGGEGDVTGEKEELHARIKTSKEETEAVNALKDHVSMSKVTKPQGTPAPEPETANPPPLLPSNPVIEAHIKESPIEIKQAADTLHGVGQSGGQEKRQGQGRKRKRKHRGKGKGKRAGKHVVEGNGRVEG